MSFSLNPILFAPSGGLTVAWSVENPPRHEISAASALGPTAANALPELNISSTNTQSARPNAEEMTKLRYTSMFTALSRLIGIERTTPWTA